MNGPARMQGGAPAEMSGSARCGPPSATGVATMPDGFASKLGQAECPMPVKSTGRAHFNPKQLFEQLVEVILPLLNSEGDFSDGKTETDLIGALKPILGDFTVEEAIYLYVVLGIAEGTFEKADVDDDPRFIAFLRARWILKDFIGNAYISGPGCASARAWLGGRSLFGKKKNRRPIRICRPTSLTGCHGMSVTCATTGSMAIDSSLKVLTTVVNLDGSAL